MADIQLKTSKKTHDLIAGSGDRGQALRLTAQAGERYELVDRSSRKGPQKLRARREGKDLQVFLEGSREADLVIENYYDDALAASGRVDLVGLNEQGRTVAYVIEQQSYPALTELSLESMPITLPSQGGVLSWDLGWHMLSQLSPVQQVGAAAVGAAWLLQGGGSAAPADLIIEGSVTAGPVFDGLRLLAYDSQGKLLGEAKIQPDGSYRITVAQGSTYRGAILVKAVDANGQEVNYLDEVLGAPKSLDVSLRGLGVSDPGNTVSFSLDASGQARLVIHLSVLSELAVR